MKKIFENVKRFDMKKKLFRQKNYFRPITWLIAFPSMLIHRTKLKKINTEKLKPPYLLLCNHNSFLDMKITIASIFPHRANFIISIDGFIKKEWLLRRLGGICKRKFTADLSVINHLKQVVRNGDVAVIYPEARYSLCGTTAVLPDSLGHLARILKVPVVTLMMHGHHITAPFWNIKKRWAKTTAELKLLLDKDELEKLPIEEINAKIRDDFDYDDFRWQKENKIKIKKKFRAQGLHRVLYRCPNCDTEYRMHSKGATLFCGCCGKEWEMTELGELSAADGNTEFPHIPDWYEWERKKVREEIKNGNYCMHSEVKIDWLPNSKGFLDAGFGTLTHSADGFLLKGNKDGEEYTLEKSVLSMYSCHIEYGYHKKYGDCIDLSTLEDTFFIYPLNENFAVTKIALATEELYHLKSKNAGHPVFSEQIKAI